MKTTMMKTMLVVAALVPALALASVQKMSGTVKSVDASALTVTSNKKDTIVAVDAKTKIEKAGKTIALTDVKAGDRVSLSAEKSGTAMTATTVKVSAPRAASTGKAAPQPRKAPAKR